MSTLQLRRDFLPLSRRARGIYHAAWDEAASRRHKGVSPSHLLLGLLGLYNTDAEFVLDEMGVLRELVRQEMEVAMVGVTEPPRRPRDIRIIGLRIGTKQPRNFYETFRSRLVFRFADLQACEMQHPQIGTGHILLGLIQEGLSTSAQVLERMGVDLPRAREALVKVTSQYGDVR